MSEMRSVSASQVQSRFFGPKFRSWLHSAGNWLYKFRPRFKDRHFWIVQALVIVIAIVHDIIEVGGYLHHFDILYFLPVSLFFVPVVYAALHFGFVGSIATVIWAIVVTIPNWVFWHEGLERLGVIFQMSLLVAVSVFAGRRVDQETIAKRQAEDASYLLKTYAGHIVNAQEEERQRIAHELHDQTIQTLSLISQRLAVMKEGTFPQSTKVTKELKEVQEIAEQASKELRVFTRSIRPPVLDDLGIVPALRRLLIESTERTGMNGIFKLVGEEQRLPQDIEIGLFRIAQEGIWNVERHSKATELIVTMTLTRAEARLNISDNGIGFTTSPALGSLYTTGKLGLLGMYERAELIGGKFDIKTELNKGTTISISVPISESTRKASDH
jgi:signal transduction histidine kinase